jgi:hypothetical protein
MILAISSSSANDFLPKKLSFKIIKHFMTEHNPWAIIIIFLFFFSFSQKDLSEYVLLKWGVKKKEWGIHANREECTITIHCRRSVSFS